MKLLDAVKTHLEPEGFDIGVGVAPAEMDDSRPFAVLYLISTTFPNEANDVELHDEAASSLVLMKAYGRLTTQAGPLLDRLDSRIRNGSLTVTGHTMQLVAREQHEGPTRDADTWPDRPLFRAQGWYRIDTAPDLT